MRHASCVVFKYMYLLFINLEFQTVFKTMFCEHQNINVATYTFIVLLKIKSLTKTCTGSSR